jgi:Zn-dependent M28 family amino/carboxypeptidase
VLGYVEGSDLKEELIVISAHLDHLGKRDDKIFYGADDDGSGCATIINMSEVFMKAKTEGKGPRRSILFITFSGEEKGLLGSEYYVNNPIFPLEKTVANLNIDMIGRVDEVQRNTNKYTYIIGSDKLSTDLHRISEEANRFCCQLHFDYKYNDPADKLKLY